MSTVDFDSTRFGRVSVNEDEIITLPLGMIGFPDHQRFALVKQSADSVFVWLHSVDDPSLAFPIAIPWMFYSNYEIDIPDADVEGIGVQSAEQLTVYCVVNIGADVKGATINLFAPLTINSETRVGRQVLNGLPGYSTKEPLFPETGAEADVAAQPGQNAPAVTVLKGQGS